MVKKHKYLFLIIILILFHVINNYFWIKRFPETGGCDICCHVDLAASIQQNFLRAYSSQSGPLEKISRLFSLAKYCEIRWPVLVHTIAVLSSLLCKDVLFCIRFSNLLYFAILIIGIYLLGKKIHSPAAGMLAACLVSLYPAVFTFSRKFGLDFPLISMVCLMIYFLLTCDGFKKRGQSIIFGISLGLSLLVKDSALFFIIGPLSFVIIKGWKEREGRMNFLISMAIALFISLVWRYKFFSSYGLRMISNTVLARNSNSQFAGGSFWEEIIFYPRGIYFHISPLFFSVFAISLIFYLRKIREAHYSIPILSILVPLLIFSVIRTKYDRYIFPLYGPIALVSAIGCLELPLKKRLKSALIFLFILAGVYQFFAISYFRNNFFIKQLSHERILNYALRSDNHRSVMEGFNGIIGSYHTGEKAIGVIEEEYCNGGFSLRLGYILKLLDYRNKILLSCEGALPSRIDNSFLMQADNYEFMIAFSQSADKPELSGLSAFPNTAGNGIEETIDKFKKFQIIKKDLLLPEKINIFLLRKNIPEATHP